MQRTEVSSREERLDIVIHAGQPPDGPVALEVEAVDETGNVEVAAVPFVVANP